MRFWDSTPTTSPDTQPQPVAPVPLQLERLKRKPQITTHFEFTMFYIDLFYACQTLPGCPKHAYVELTIETSSVGSIETSSVGSIQPVRHFSIETLKEKMLLYFQDETPEEKTNKIYIYTRRPDMMKIELHVTYVTMP